MSVCAGVGVHARSPWDVEIKVIRRRRTLYITLEAGKLSDPADWRLGFELTLEQARRFVEQLTRRLAALERVISEEDSL